MDSQEDIFATQQQPKKKKTNYEFLVLCDKDEKATEPFSMYPASMFSDNEILGRWLDSILDSSSRLKTIQSLQKSHNKNLCLFGKVPSGIISIIPISLNRCVVFYYIYIYYYRSPEGAT